MTEEELRALFGSRVKHFRKAKGLSQSELADKVNEISSWGNKDLSTSKQVIANIESGKKFVSAKTLTVLAQALEKAVWELFQEFEHPSALEREKLIQTAKTGDERLVQTLNEIGASIAENFVDGF